MANRRIQNSCVLGVMYKICTECKNLLPTTSFFARNQRPIGLRSECKNCWKARRKQHLKTLRLVDLSYWSRQAKRTKEWRFKNPELSKMSIRASMVKYREKYRPVKAAKERRRQAMKLLAIPKWANKKYIGLFYLHSKLESQRTGRACQVDHIVPLKSKDVCGLHCEQNLQVLFKEDNLKKRNLMWPDQ